VRVPELRTDTLIEYVLPQHQNGRMPITIRDALLGNQVIAQTDVSYRTPPAVTAVINTSGGSGQAGDEFLVTGARLYESAIRINDQDVDVIHGSNTATALRFRLPSLPVGPGGAYRLDIAGDNGVTTTTFTSASSRPKGPVITGLENDDHANLTHGWAGASMTVSGWGLAGSRVSVDGRPAQVLESFDDQLTFVLPAHPVGDVDVTVSNRLGSTWTGASYLTPSRMPTISSIHRLGSSSVLGHGGDQFVITGTHLSPTILTVDDAVPGEWGPTDSLAPTKLVVTLSPHAPAADVPVRLISPYGRAVAYINVDIPVRAPALSALATATGSTAGGEIQVRGTGFSPLSVTAWADGTVIPAAYVNSSTLKVVLPAHAAGLGRVTVTAGNAHLSVTKTFNYLYRKLR